MKNLLQQLLMVICIFISSFFSGECYAQKGRNWDSESSSEKDSLFKKEKSKLFYREISKKTKKVNKRVLANTKRTLATLDRKERRLSRFLGRKDLGLYDKFFGKEQITFSKVRKDFTTEGFNNSILNEKKYNRYLDKLGYYNKYVHINKIEGKDSFAYMKAERLIREAGNNFNGIKETERLIERRVSFLEQNFGSISKSKKPLLNLRREIIYYNSALKNFQKIFYKKGKYEKEITQRLSASNSFNRFYASESALKEVFPFLSLQERLSTKSQAVLEGIPLRQNISSFIEKMAGGEMIDLSNNLNSNFDKYIFQLEEAKKVGVIIIDSLKKHKKENLRYNSQKSKTFSQRLEYGADFQFLQGGKYLPATGDFSLKIGYRFTDCFSMGVGLNNKFGFGNGWNNLSLTHEGIGGKAYLKNKIKRGFALLGSCEYNYMSSTKKTIQANEMNSKQYSIFFGIGKSYQLNKKVRNNIQVLYNFLYRDYQPLIKPIIIRFGYDF